MSDVTSIANITGAHALASQVGGHKGVLTSDDDSLIIKPALPLEVKFYQTLNFDPTFESLRPFVPKFIGILRLEGELIRHDGDIEEKNIRTIVDGADKSSVVLENLTRPFLKPNILDVKLGTVLYDEVAAPPDKKERMIATARDTTSLETGIRLTGFQVYDNMTNGPIVTPKSYGKSIKKSQLPEGIARFFPVGSKEEGRPSPGLPAHLLFPVLYGIREEIAEIREVLASLEIRIVGGSFLIVYEGDWGRADEALKHAEENRGSEEEEEEEEEDSDDEEKPGPPYIVKLIDFAHTRITPGKGSDKGVLTGVDTLLSLLDGRIKELTS